MGIQVPVTPPGCSLVWMLDGELYSSREVADRIAQRYHDRALPRFVVFTEHGCFLVDQQVERPVAVDSSPLIRRDELIHSAISKLTPDEREALGLP